jgi:hypothetical protein
MICVSLQSYVRACAGVTGGVSDIMVFDPSDFNFTQSPSNGPYTAVALRTGASQASGGLMFPISFNQDEANRAWTQSRKGCAVKYEHTVNAQLPQLSNALTNFLQSMDAAGCCCGIGIAIRHNDGKIFIMGEKYVGGSSIGRFTVTMDGATGDSGKLMDDFNGANVVFKGSYSRDLREYTGTWATLEAFTTAVTP